MAQACKTPTTIRSRSNKLYGKAKATPTGRRRGPPAKSVGKPDAGNRHVRFDERGRETERLPTAQATAPFLDSTDSLIADCGARRVSLRPPRRTAACGRRSLATPAPPSEAPKTPAPAGLRNYADINYGNYGDSCIFSQLRRGWPSSVHSLPAAARPPGNCGDTGDSGDTCFITQLA